MASKRARVTRKSEKSSKYDLEFDFFGDNDMSDDELMRLARES